MPLDYPIHRRTLPNGLRVVVSPDHTVPNVTVNLWFGVGSRHESAGRTGFAHLFEHLMFQGSRGRAQRRALRGPDGAGRRGCNATTWFDRTNYFETVPTGRRRARPVARGRPARAPPRRRAPRRTSTTSATSSRRRSASATTTSPTATPSSTSTPRSSRRATPTTTRRSARWRTSTPRAWTTCTRSSAPTTARTTPCSPCAATSPREEGFDLVERYFGDLPAGAAPRRPTLDQLDPLDAPVRVDRHEVVPNDRLHVAFRLPVDETDEFLAAAVALDCIGGLATSRLVRRLVRREQIALGAHATAWGFVDGASLGFVVLDVAPGTDRGAGRGGLRRGARGLPRARPDRRSSSRPRSPSPSARGSRRWPARRSVPT